MNSPCRRRLGWAFVLMPACVLLLLQACGGGTATDRSKSQIRLVNATSPSGGYPQLALRLDDQQRQGQVGYGDNAVYAEVDDGSPTLTITNQTSSTALLTASTSLTKGRYYTALAFGSAGALRQVLLDDNQADPEVNKASLRVINASPDSGSLDVYLTGSDEALSSAVAVEAGAAYGSVGAWRSVGSAGWRLRVTAANSKTDVRLDLPNLTLSSRQIATLVLTPGSGGVLTSALVLTQRGGITRLDNTQARVRVVAGLAGAGSVTASVSATPVLTAAPSPSVSAYTLVSASSPLVSLLLDGAALPVGGPTPSRGADLTLLVQGSTSTAAQQAGASAPKGTWLVDSNRAPADATQARVRLVNGLAEPGEKLALSVDFQPLASNVEAGKSSGYAETAPGTTIVLRALREGPNTELFRSTEQTLVAGGTYSLFIVGSVAEPVGIWRRDR